MAGIKPENYQAYVQGKMSYEQATGGSNIPAPTATKPVTSTASTFTPTAYSQGNNFGVGSSYNPTNTPAPAAITQQAKPQTSPSGQTQLPSWMGNMYSQVPGTNYYSTNPSNQNASKYYADGSPVASVGFDYTQTGGGKFDGYASPEQFKQIMNLNNSGSMNTQGGQQSMQNLLQGWQKEGSLVSNSSIYAPSGGYVNAPPTPEQAKTGSGMLNSNSGTVYAPQSSMTNVPQLSSTQQSATDWINNSTSGQGGIANYINTQQAKYDAAVRSGDQNMLNALNTDMQRVGYSLNMSNSGQPQGQGQSNNGNQTAQSNGAVQLPNGGWAPGNNVYGLGNDQYAALQAQANASSAADIAAQATIAGQQKSGYQSNFDRMQSQTKDNRALENFKNSQLLNPFNGYSDYAQGQINREREITDRQGQQDLQSKLGNVDAQLADYAKSSTAKKQEIVTQLAKDLSSYQMQVEQLKLQQGDLALKSQNQQFNQQQDVKKQHIDLANFLTQQYGVTVLPTDDPMLSYAQVAGIPTTAAQKIAIDAQNSNFDNAVKKALAENTINKTQADILQGAQQLAIAQQNANTSSANAGTSAASQGTAAARLEWEKSQAANKPKDYKTSPEFAKDIAHIKNNPTEASKLDSNPQPFIEAYGYDGYLALRKAAGIDD